MKITFFIIAILASVVYGMEVSKALFSCIRSVPRDNILEQSSDCIYTCLYDKIGVMVDNKIHPEKYFNIYMADVNLEHYDRPKLRECINEANEQIDEKCGVEKSLRKCIDANRNLIYLNPPLLF